MATLLTSMTRPNAGGAQPAYVESYDGRLLTTNGLLTQNAAHLVNVRVGKPLPVTTAEFYVTVQNGNINAGLFSFDGTNFVLLASTGSTAVGAANAVQSVALTTGYTLQPGVDYWVALATDSASFQCLRVAAISTGVGGSGNKVLVKTSLFVLATFDTPAGGTVYPWVRLK